MRYTARILKCDEPTDATGKIYPTDEVRKAIREYMSNEHYNLGEMDGTGHTISFDNVSHSIVDTYIDDEGWWTADIEILDTPNGKILKQLREMDIPVALMPRSIGTVDSYSFKISNLQIVAIDVAGAAEPANIHDRPARETLSELIYRKMNET